MKIMKQTINPRKAIRNEIVTGYTGLQFKNRPNTCSFNPNGEAGQAAPLNL